MEWMGLRFSKLHAVRPSAGWAGKQPARKLPTCPTRRLNSGLLVAVLVGAASVARAQIPANLSLPNETVSSGAATYEATSTITAMNGFAVQGTANVTFQSGGTITLGPGFTAVAGSGSTFKALISTPPAANFSLSAPAAVSVNLGQTATVQGTITPAAGFTGSVSLAITSPFPVPSWMTPPFSPNTVSVTGTSAVPFNMSFGAGPGAPVSSTPISLLVTAEGAPTEYANVALTINGLPNPVISLDAPTPSLGGTPPLVYGNVTLSGYALEPTPLLSTEAITGVNITLASDDDSGLQPIVATAAYGSHQTPRYDACGGNGQQGAYPNSPGCPYVGFSYPWDTGTNPTVSGYVPNAVYTATISASDNSSPPVSASYQTTVALDNQVPTPVINSPIDRSGLPGVQQNFSITFTSPNSLADIGNGTVQFVGASTCVLALNTSPASLSLTSGASACTLASGATITPNSATNSITVQFGITFQATMAGNVSVEAEATNAIGQTSPLSTLTNFNVIGPQIISGLQNMRYLSVYGSANAGYTGTFCQSIDVVGVAAGTPVSVTLNTQESAPYSFTASYVSSSGQYCPAGTIQIVAGIQANNDPGTEMVPLPSYTITAGAATLTMTLYVFASAQAPYSLSFSPANITAAAGQTVTTTLNVAPQTGSAGSIGLTVSVNPNPDAPTGQLVFTVSPSPATIAAGGGASTVTIAVDPATPPGVYAVYALGSTSDVIGYAGAFLTVTGSTPDFTISSVTPVSMQPAQAVSFSAEILPVAGFNGTVTLKGMSPGDAPGMSLPASVSLASGGQSFTGTVVTTNSAVTCSYALPITAISGSLQHTAYVNVSVNGGAAAPFALPSLPGVSVQAGQQSTTFPVTASATSCISGTPSFAFSGFPSGITFTPLFNPINMTGPFSPASPITLDYFSVSASSSVPAQAYTGTLTVTLGSNSYTSPLVVTVLAPPPPPTYTLTCLNCGAALPVTAGGGPVPAIIQLTPSNGYALSPTLSTGSLPSGVTVAFDNSGVESYPTYMVDATITVSAGTAAGTYSIPIYAYDGAKTGSFSFSITVGANPISIDSTVTYSYVSATNYMPQLATITPVVTGGTPPYTYTYRDSASNAVLYTGPLYLTSGSLAADQHFQLTVTDANGHSASKYVLVKAASVYPLDKAETFMLSVVSSTESLASTLTALGDDPTTLRAHVQSQLGVSAAQYGNSTSGLVQLAAQLQSGHAANSAAFQTAVNTLHSSGTTVAAATHAQLAPLANTYTADASLEQSVTGSVNGLFDSSGDSGLPTSFWNYFGPGLSDCDPDFGCDPCDPAYQENCTQPIVVWYAWGTAIVVDPTTALLQASTTEVLTISGDAIDPDESLCVDMTVSSNFQILGGQLNNCGTPYMAYASVEGYPNPGTYTVYGVAEPFSGGLYESGGFITLPEEVTQVSLPLPLDCTQPQISGVLVNGDPATTIVPNTRGTLNVIGCFPGSMPGLSFSDSTISITGVSGSGGQISATYSVPPGTQPEETWLVATDSTGSASADIEVNSASTYIASIFPPVWPAGASTTVTIEGAGFGSVQSTLSVIEYSTGASENWPASQLVITSWTDTTITAVATPPSASAGDTITLKVTPGGYGSYFQAPTGQPPSVQGPPVNIFGQSSTVSAQILQQLPALVNNDYSAPYSPIYGNSSANPVTVAVGQQIALEGVVNNLPAGVSVVSQSWSVPVQGTTVGGFTQIAQTTGNSSVPIFNQPTTTFYWYNAVGTVEVQYSATLSTSQNPVTASAFFNVVGPMNANMNPPVPSLGAVNIFGPSVTNNGYYQSFGCYNANPDAQGTCQTGYVPGITFKVTENDPPLFPGVVSFLQILSQDTQTTVYPAYTHICTQFSNLVLDKTNPYGNVQGDLLKTTDSPGIGLNPLTSEDTRQFTAQMWAMWSPGIRGAKPPTPLPNSIPVPLGTVTWGYASDATQNANGSWSKASNIPNANQGTTGPFLPSMAYYPSWTAWTGKPPSQPNYQTCTNQ